MLAGLSALHLEPRRALRRAGLWTVVVSPVVAAVAMGSTLYDGVRRLLFIYVLAASGWTGVLCGARPPWLHRSAPLGLALGLASLGIFDPRLHPKQGVYFNGRVGASRGAFKRYEMDYG